ncbi:MAG: hypothetical protein MUE73_17085 [Planctomycetes bacterium]|jgi:hypothetical protein|nr:hypothetical protein [Planctomycetota bacterium]
MGRRTQYSFGKRQRELKRKEKAEKKRIRRQGPGDPATETPADGDPPDGAPDDSSSPTSDDGPTGAETETTN